MFIVLQLLLLGAGFFMLTRGADFFVDGAAGLAERLRIPHLIIGLTIVAMGTSAPEAAVSIAAAIKDSADITVGNIIGSNLMNILVILGITSIITTLKVARSAVYVEMPFLIGLFILFTVLGLDGSISPPEGIFFWFLFIVYLIYLFRLARNFDAPEPEPEVPQRSIWLTIILTAVGMIFIIFGSDITVDAAVALAESWGWSQRFIGLTIVSLGTTLPEQVTSITAARKGQADIAIGNILGSCIFNVLFVIGSASIVVSIPFAEAFQRDAWVTVAAAVLLFLCCFREKELNRKGGILLLSAYAIYFFFIALQA